MAQERMEREGEGISTYPIPNPAINLPKRIILIQ